MIKQVKILGVKVDSGRLRRLLAAVEEKISRNFKFYIVTPNPELILSSTKNPALKQAMNQADFSIPDGVGLKLAEPSLKIIKGRDFFLDLVSLAARKNWRVFLLGGLGNEAKIASSKLKSKNKKLKIAWAGGPKITTNLSKDIVDKINKFAPDLLFVAFGNPKQEIFMYENIKKLNVRGMMGVGGTFRYVAGMSKLSPKWMDKLGLEWLWRLFTEPFRFARIWNAAVVFPLRVLRETAGQALTNWRFG